MPVTGSGEIKLRADVNEEINGNDTDTNVSLRSLSEDAGKSVPDSLAEFYGYSNVVAPSVSVGSESVAQTSLTVRGTLSNNGGESIGTGSMKIYFGTNSNVTSNTQYSVSHSTGTSGASGSTYTYSASGLSAGTTYYYAFKATNSAGTTTTGAGSTTTPLPSLGLSVTLNSWGSLAGRTMYMSITDAMSNCDNNSTNGWAVSQNGQFNFQLNGSASTPNMTGITGSGWCNWTPYQTLSHSYFSPTLGNSSASVSVSGSCHVQYVTYPHVSCGSIRSVYTKYVLSGYTTYQAPVAYFAWGA